MVSFFAAATTSVEGFRGSLLEDFFEKTSGSLVLWVLASEASEVEIWVQLVTTTKAPITRASRVFFILLFILNGEVLIQKRELITHPFHYCLLVASMSEYIFFNIFLKKNSEIERRTANLHAKQ